MIIVWVDTIEFFCKIVSIFIRECLQTKEINTIEELHYPEYFTNITYDVEISEINKYGDKHAL
jgi:hypothetical protein